MQSKHCKDIEQNEQSIELVGQCPKKKPIAQANEPRDHELAASQFKPLNEWSFALQWSLGHT